jgi:hypothetical protein
MNLCELANICTGPELLVWCAVLVIGLTMCCGYEEDD